MAKKRPLKTTAHRGGKVIATGHAATLKGAVLAATKRLLTQRASVVEVTTPRERVIAVIGWDRMATPRISIALHRGHRRWLV